MAGFDKLLLYLIKNR